MRVALYRIYYSKIVQQPSQKTRSDAPQETPQIEDAAKPKRKPTKPKQPKQPKAPKKKKSRVKNQQRADT